jgi:16S rRNA (uracil1498-N3)-methyltransferase
MRLPRIHVDDELLTGQVITLPAETSHYLIQVLRLKSGDSVRPFNRSSGEHLATIENPDRKKATLTIGEQTVAKEEGGLVVNLGLGLSRGDRFDFAIQKATELGVSSITPLYTEFSEVKFTSSQRKDKKHLHWQKIAISAAEQSGRISVPTIQSPVQLDVWASEASDEALLILSPRAQSGFSAVKKSASCSLLIGPEGGFSSKEEQIAQQHGFQSVALGPRTLRTETAPLAALAILQFIMGDLA